LLKVANACLDKVVFVVAFLVETHDESNVLLLKVWNVVGWGQCAVTFTRYVSLVVRTCKRDDAVLDDPVQIAILRQKQGTEEHR
jgi:hypothetical protein